MQFWSSNIDTLLPQSLNQSCVADLVLILLCSCQDIRVVQKRPMAFILGWIVELVPTTCVFLYFRIEWSSSTLAPHIFGNEPRLTNVIYNIILGQNKWQRDSCDNNEGNIFPSSLLDGRISGHSINHMAAWEITIPTLVMDFWSAYFTYYGGGDSFLKHQ